MYRTFMATTEAVFFFLYADIFIVRSKKRSMREGDNVKKFLIYCDDIRENIEHREDRTVLYSININHQFSSSSFFFRICSKQAIYGYSSANLMTL